MLNFIPIAAVLSLAAVVVPLAAVATDGIGPETTISIATAIGIIGLVMAILKVFSRINTRLAHLENLTMMISRGMKETWSRKDQKIYSLELRIKNPNLHVPHIDTDMKEDP